MSFNGLHKVDWPFTFGAAVHSLALPPKLQTMSP